MLEKEALEQIGLGNAVGHLRVMVLPKDAPPYRIVEVPNLVLYGWADVATQLHAGNAEYRVGTMYFEFENLANPADMIPPPTFDRSGGVSYYNNLSSPKDFLRVPITISPTIISSDPSKYQGNQITFFTVTEGAAGEHGVIFDNASNSTVYGYGLVSSPVQSDQSQDIVVARTYPTGGQITKPLNAQIGAQWTIRFG